MKHPEVLFDLHSGTKSDSNPHILKDDFRKLQRRYKTYQQVYTDRSKGDSTNDGADISDNHSNSTVYLVFHQFLVWPRKYLHSSFISLVQSLLPKDTLLRTYFTSEANAVDLVSGFIRICDSKNKCFLFSGSLLALKAMGHSSSKNSHIQKLLENVTSF